MNRKQRRFVAEYLKDQNGTQAAIRTGYSPKTAAQQATRLIRNAHIGAAVARGLERIVDECELSAQRTLEEIRRLALQMCRTFIAMMASPRRSMS